MNLDKLGDLTKEENFTIASTLHAVILGELFVETDWLLKDAVFHGGTALSMTRSSGRFSEDLDFMISEEASASLDKSIGRVLNRVDAAFGTLFPGGTVTVKGPKGKEVDTWQFVWRHPNRRQKVMVKAEFLTTTREILANYRSTHVVPTSNGIFGVGTQIPVPDLVSAWGDKIKAIATRPAFKWRDAYDIGWIGNLFLRDGDPGDDERRDAIAASAAIYGKSLDDVAEGLERVLGAGAFDNIPRFEDDMARWFPDNIFMRSRRTGHYRDLLETARGEAERGMLVCRLGHGPRP